MNKNLIKYFKANSFYKYYKNLTYLLDKDLNDETTIKEVYSSMLVVFKLYYKLIRQEFRDNNESYSLPREIFLEAGRRGYEKFSKIWLKFIDLLNIQAQEINKEEKTKIKKFVIESFKGKFYLMLDYVQRYVGMELLEETFKYCENLAFDEKPLLGVDSISTYEEIGISEKSYYRIINYFKSNPLIKNVWIYGSRVYGTAEKGSEIDMVVDAPADKIIEIKRELSELVIPHYIDSKCLNDESDKPFIAIVVPRGIKKIYSNFAGSKVDLANVNLKPDLSKLI
jgi:predicted nucleotidyltransferase